MAFKPESRQYRSFSAANFRALENEDGTESYTVRGYFTVFDTEYQVCDWMESIDPRALDDADMSDVIMLYDHAGDVLARQRNGSLTIGVDEKGGWIEARLDGCRRARDLFESIKNGLVAEMSFAFTIANDGIDVDEDEDGVIHARIGAISKVWDVSCVSVPANPDTAISARSFLDGVIEERRMQQEVLRRAEEERQRKDAAIERLRGLSLV